MLRRQLLLGISALALTAGRARGQCVAGVSPNLAMINPDSVYGMTGVSQIIDANFNVWTLAGTQMYKNGALLPYTINVTNMLYMAATDTIWQKITVGPFWYGVQGSANGAAVPPSSAFTPGQLNDPRVSPNLTTINSDGLYGSVPAFQGLIYDNNLNQWAISQGLVLKNGVWCPNVVNVTELVFLSASDTLWQKTSSCSWYGVNGGALASVAPPLPSWSGPQATDPRAAGGGLLAPGNLYWGVNGKYNAEDGEGQYVGKNDAKIIADLQNIFGMTPNTIFYRAFENYQQTPAQLAAAVPPYVAAGIVPVFIIEAYPDFTASQTTAYNNGYAMAQSYINAWPQIPVIEIGNEWTINGMTAGGGWTPGTVATPAQWRASAQYPAALGYHAGVIAACRDLAPSCKVIGGANSGWVTYSLSNTLAADLVNYAPPGGGTRNLLFDLVVLHHYQDVEGCGQQVGPTLSNTTTGNMYTNLFPAGVSMAVTEYGSSGCFTGNYTNAGAALTTMMADMKTNKLTTGSQSGVRLAIIYELYGPDPGVYDYALYTTTNGSGVTTINEAGTAVKNWLANPANGNPS